MKKILLYLFVFVCFVSCSTHEDVVENPLNTLQPDTDDIAYAKKHLKVLGEFASELANTDNSYRNLIYNEVEKRFDGEYNVLFQTIDSILFSDKVPYSIARTETESYKVALKAFLNKEGINYFSQIYIPFYEELQKRKAKPNYQQKSPVIILLAGDSQQDVFEGYQLEDGKFDKTRFLIDESYARNHEVWVISLNERYFGKQTSNLDYYNTNGRIEASASAWIENMKCKCHKETWAAGGSEVNMITVFSDWGFYHDDTEVNTYGGGDYEGGNIKKFERKDVKNKTQRTVNFPLLNHWDARMPNTPYASYVIFEYDTWPTGLKKVTWNTGGQNYTREYRSADDYYDMSSVSKTFLHGYTVNNSCIEWNGLYY